MAVTTNKESSAARSASSCPTSRQLAVDSTDTGKNPPYRAAARTDLPGGWRKGAQIEKRGDVTVSVRLKVPVLIPAFRSPIEIGTTADTSVEGEPLPDRQDFTPTPTPEGT